MILPHDVMNGGTSTATAKVYVVDDDRVARDCLQEALRRRGYDVMGFESGGQFLQMAATLPPGIVLSDLRMPGGDGFDLLLALKAQQSRFPVIILTGYGDIPVAVRAMKLGAADFVEKPFSVEALAEIIACAQARLLVGDDQHGIELGAEQARQRLAVLTPREREVLDGIVKGWTNRMIAQHFNISQRTIELHRAHLMKKLGLRNVSQVVRLALAASA